jgi:LPXTG-site transpeptidase (sortase) family protein
MNKDLSTEFPKPPKLQPAPSTRFKIWRIVSSVFTVSGLALMGAGGWMFYQQQVEANKPPPARILEVSVADTEPTATPLPTSTPLKPTVSSKSSDDTAQVNRPTITSTAGPVSTTEPEPDITTPVAEPAAPAGSPIPEPVEDDILSLADNPLLMVEDEPEGVEVLPDTEEGEASADAPVPSNAALTRIVAESIDMDAEVVEVGWQQVIQDGIVANVWKVADYAAGRHINSKLPGQNGNIVLSAHHNIKGEVFRYTVDLEPGDIVTVYDAARSYDYIVEDKFIVKDKGEPESVRRENGKWIGPFNEERLTLITCWPYNNNTHRLIVIAKPAGQAQAEVQE